METPSFYSKIKDVFVELHHYDFYHSPSNLDKTNKHFIGREKVINRIRTLISGYSTTEGGAYLVTGYRGVGKTSVVREALDPIVSKESCDKKKKQTDSQSEFDNGCYRLIELSLSQEDIKDVDLLRQIARLIYLEWVKLKLSLPKKTRPRKWEVFNVIFLTFLITVIKILQWGFDIDLSLSLGNPFTVAVGFIAASTLIAFISLFRFLDHKFFPSPEHPDYDKILEAIGALNDRLFATVTIENAKATSAQINLGNKLFSEMALGRAALFSRQQTASQKSARNYSVATPKEIEKELLRILDMISDYRKSQPNEVPKFIIVIDELDKIEPNYFYHPGEHDDSIANMQIDSGFTRQKKRQEAIAKLLANMKSFLNSAKAKFIFIGGRELYDASLADIADRESFYSSIFNEVIYIKSFFKDRIEKQTGITDLIEGFLCQFLNPNIERAPDTKRLLNYGLKDYIEYCHLELGIHGKELFKLAFLLQNFIIFLTFRSNGSPKKLIEIFEKYVFRIDASAQNDVNTYIVERNENKRNNLFLRFTFKDQYEIGATANLYRPYLIIHSRHLKLLGDKLLYSTAFLMDHLLKFHKHAFSWRNLELIPEIILINKDPNLRFFLKDIMDFLFHMHIRKTTNAIFQFKFFRKVTNEIEYLTKTSELSSAAFNFTVDESFHLKHYYKKKLISRFDEEKNSTGSIPKSYVHSIGYIQSILGDLFFYDGEYDDAIKYYSDSVQTPRAILANNGKLTYHQGVLFFAA